MAAEDVRIGFEVFGKVQGVFFRVTTQSKAEELGLTGWVKNTRSGTVVGEAQGPLDAIEKMKDFLENEGSPNSSIDRAEFTDKELVDDETKFVVVRKNIGRPVRT